MTTATCTIATDADNVCGATASRVEGQFGTCTDHRYEHAFARYAALHGLTEDQAFDQIGAMDLDELETAARV